jgi:peptidyl-prolyl cis-trans isomerase C
MMTQTINASADSLNYRLLRIASDHYGVALENLDDAQREQALAIAQRELFMEQAVLNSVEARHVVVAASEVDKAVTRIRDRYSDEQAFLTSLEDAAIDEQELGVALERELRVDAILNLVSSRVPEADDTEVELFYYVHREKFEQPQMRTVRHILITINPEFAENTAKAALQRINLIAARIAKQPRRFSEQALKHSECPTALEGGLLGKVKPGTLYPELDAVLFLMEEGSISEAIESPVGYHLLLCEAIHPARVVPLADIKAKLRNQLTQRQRLICQRTWLKSLLNPNTPEVETTSWQKKLEQN